MLRNQEELRKADKIKAIITDLDNTLWKGTLAEKQEPILNKEYFKFLKSLYSKGIQLIVVSKNDLKDVTDAFKKLEINEEFFTAIIANWDPKYLNIERIIDHAEFRPETVVFIDDNPLERKEVKIKLEPVHVLDILDWKDLKEIPYVQGRKEQPIGEIKTRINRYRTSLKSKESENKSSPDSSEFLKSLNREISVGEIDPDNLDRFTRLFVETHRINFNPGKFSDYEKALEYLHGKLNEGDKLYAISTNEAGYSLGLTGAIVISIKKGIAKITDGTYSCGIIGRGFEQKSLLMIIKKLKKLDIETLEIEVTLTGTNKRVREFLNDLNFKEAKRSGKKITYEVNLKGYSPQKDYGWIKSLKSLPDLFYAGHMKVMSLFEKKVRPLIKKESKVINLGSSRGEVLGHLQKEVKKEFDDFLKSKNVTYKKIDLEDYPEEENIVGDAEDLSKIVETESQDLVMAIELLEHTEHPWRVINEIIRICKINGHIFITVPSFNYPKHEYPIDLWRIGPKTLTKFFPEDSFKIVKLEKEGDRKVPRRTMILVQKQKNISAKYDQPKNGKTNWKTGITVFD